jgi:hypothetical protein
MLLSFSCNHKAPGECAFSIINNTSQKIDSVRITSTGLKEIFINIEPKQKLEKTFSIKHFPRYEGAFLATIFIKDSARNQATFGYFDSPEAIKEHYTIEIGEGFSIKQK